MFGSPRLSSAAGCATRIDESPDDRAPGAVSSTLGEMVEDNEEIVSAPSLGPPTAGTGCSGSTTPDGALLGPALCPSSLAPRACAPQPLVSLSISRSFANVRILPSKVRTLWRGRMIPPCVDPCPPARQLASRSGSSAHPCVHSQCARIGVDRRSCAQRDRRRVPAVSDRQTSQHGNPQAGGARVATFPSSRSATALASLLRHGRRPAPPG
jgi:hypothetical protein